MLGSHSLDARCFNCCKMGQRAINVMADLIFACPSCHKDISCDPAWAGQQVQCPLCQSPVTVPQPQAASPQPQAKIAVSRSSHASEAATRSKPVYRELVAPPPPKQSPLVKWGATVVVVAALGTGAYFGYGWWQQRQEAEAAAAVAASDAGTSASIVAEAPADGTAGSPGQELPVVAPAWSLDLDTAKIPDGRVNGMIAGTNFVADTARLAFTGNAYLLSLSQGEAATPDREFWVFLRPKRGQPLTNQTWTISKEMKGTGVPQVAKRWKNDPRRAPSQKNFSTGYAMKLELGEVGEGGIAGKIYAALPDAEQTVVAGNFTAVIAVPGMASPVATPSMQPGGPMAEMPPEMPSEYRTAPRP